MNRAEYIRSYKQNRPGFLYTTFISAMTTCLTPQEACDALDTSFEQDYDRRRILLRKIARDVEHQLLKCHESLVENLFVQLETLPYRKQVSCAKSLCDLSASLPIEMRRRITRTLLTSAKATLRKQGAKILMATWDAPLAADLRLSWEKYSDYDCARLLIENDDVSYLCDQRRDLSTVSAGTWLLGRLYLRLAEIDASLVDEVEGIDPITFAYVLAKKGRRISPAKARKLANQYLHDDRFGLLVWSLGQMSLWTVVVELAKNYEQLGLESFHRRHPRFATPPNSPHAP